MSTEETATAAATVALPPKRAFAAFAEDLGRWWPREYTWSQDTLEEIGIEPREGGACFELGPHGFRCDWGRVIAWEPPHRLRILWQISPARVPVPDPAAASEVEVEFRPDADSTRVALVHSAFARHGEGADGYRAAMDSAQGWDLILGRFAEYAAAADRD